MLRNVLQFVPIIKKSTMKKNFSYAPTRQNLLPEHTSDVDNDKRKERKKNTYHNKTLFKI